MRQRSYTSISVLPISLQQLRRIYSLIFGDVLNQSPPNSHTSSVFCCATPHANNKFPKQKRAKTPTSQPENPTHHTSFVAHQQTLCRAHTTMHFYRTHTCMLSSIIWPKSVRTNPNPYHGAKVKCGDKRSHHSVMSFRCRVSLVSCGQAV